MSKLEQLTDAQLAGLKAAYKRSLKNRRKRAPAEHFPWHKIQEWVFKAPTLVANPIRVILAVGGNRSGKSKLAMGMLDEILRRESPINDQLMTTDKFTGEIRPKDDRDPLRVWIVPPTGEKFRQDWVNPADGMGIRHWMGDRYIDHRQSPDYVFYGKVPGLEPLDEDGDFDPSKCDIILGKSQDQKMETFEASEVDVAIFDEEPQNPDIVAATRMRLATSNGVLIFAFTPLHGLSWSYDKWWNPLIKQGQAKQYRDRCWIHAPGDDDMGAVIACQMGMADNPRAEVYAREYLNDPTTSEAEKAARVYGEYGFVEGALIEQLAGIDLVHPSPEHRTYVVDELPPDSAIDKWYLVADPNKSYGALLSCIDHDGNLFFVAEHLRKSWPNRKHAESFKEMEKKYATGPVNRYADPGSAGAQAQIDLEDFGLYFDTVNRGPGSVSRSIKRLRGLAWVDPDHVHPITGTQGAPRVYFYAPGLVERRDQGGMSVVGSQLAEQMSQARQKENAPPDTPDKSSKKLDLFDCARYTADMAMTHGPSGQGDRNRKFDMSNRLPTDREFSKMHSMPDMSLGSAKLWLPEYDFSNL